MRNVYLFLIFFIGLAPLVRAQITITNAVFPVEGDTLHYAFDNQPGGINALTPPGGNQEWDFSSLQASLTWDQVFVSPQTGVAQAAYPGATLLYTPLNSDVEAYLNVTNDKVSLLGFYGDDPIGLGLNLVTMYNPPIVQARQPVNFFDINQISSGLLLPFSSNLLPAEILNQLPVTPDSLRIRLAINRLDVVDGWGDLSIPGGVFEVLREKRTEYRETRLDAKVPPLGWLDITDVAIQSLGISTLGVDTTVTLHFLNNQSKEPIAICTLDNALSQVVSVQFKNLNFSTGVTDPGRTAVQLSVFPNPAEETLTLRATDIAPGAFTLIIYDALGREAAQKKGILSGNHLAETIQVDHLEAGVYWCKFLQENVHGANGWVQTGLVRFVKQ